MSNVSIHARFISRAIPPAVDLAKVLPGFNPRPVYKPGDTLTALAHLLPGTSFNPRPVYKPGDTCIARPKTSRRSRFNPRPVYKPGDTSVAGRKQWLLFCFNPRPVYKPGDTLLDDLIHVIGKVSIHARFISRAIPLWCCRAEPQHAFQSTPGL